MFELSGVRVTLLPAAIVNISPTLAAFKLVAPTLTVPKALLFASVAHSIFPFPAFLYQLLKRLLFLLVQLETAVVLEAQLQEQNKI